MATFKAGQRVRITSPGVGARHQLGFIPQAGLEGTVVHDEGAGWVRVAVDNLPPCKRCGDGWDIERESLQPLTDPKADAFLESMRNMKPQPEIVLEEISRDIHNKPIKV